MVYINANATYNALVFYSSLYDYTAAVNALNLTWDLEEGTDFYNYQSAAHAWCMDGILHLKSFVRSRERYLRSAELLFVFATNLNVSFDAEQAMALITKLRRAVDVGQHHAGITGTERDHVYLQYIAQTGSAISYRASHLGQGTRGIGGT